MTILMGLMFLLAGIVCINQPTLIAEWVGNLLKRAGNPNEQAWLKGRRIIFFIRLIGFLALINAVMYLYLSQNT